MRVLPGLSAVTAAMLLTLSAAQAACGPEMGRISVQGESSIKVAPDQAVLSFKAKAEHADAVTARNQVEKQVSSFLTEMKTLKLAEDAVKSGSISLSPQYSYPDQKHYPKLEGYRAVRNIEITVTDFTLISKITDLALKAGINSISGFNYALKDEKEVQQQAQWLAINDAKNKAQTLALGFGAKLGQPCRLEFAPEGRAVPMMMRAAAMPNDTAAPAIYLPEDLEVHASVNAEFSIAP